jgi:ElaB/YqjD/DUF883 family membrane-anchored ribosome-binding protein
MKGELKNVITEAESLLKTTGMPEGEAFKTARAKFEVTLKNAKEEVLGLEHEMVEKVKGAAHATDEYVRDHAWNVAGAGACVGLLVGLLAARSHQHGSRQEH